MSNGTPLATYLVQTDQSASQFGAKVGAHRTQIDRIAKGERGASGLLALAIERETRGAVKASDVLRTRKTRKRRAPRPRAA